MAEPGAGCLRWEGAEKTLPKRMLRRASAGRGFKKGNGRSRTNTFVQRRPLPFHKKCSRTFFVSSSYRNLILLITEFSVRVLLFMTAVPKSGQAASRTSVTAAFLKYVVTKFRQQPFPLKIRCLTTHCIPSTRHPFHVPALSLPIPYQAVRLPGQSC